jgi:hypothetical protein
MLAWSRQAARRQGDGAAFARGLALVADGEVAEDGRLDEAATAATAGETTRRSWRSSAATIDACRVRDFDRAGERYRRVEEISARFGDAELFASCRTFYGEVLAARSWSEADAALTGVCATTPACRTRRWRASFRLAGCATARPPRPGAGAG